MDGSSDPGARSRYSILVAAVVVVAVAGYLGYVVYPRFGLPAVEGVALLGLAAAAGVASFFSPCSFPLMVTLLARQAVDDSEAGRRPRPVVFGGSIALGAAAFMLLAGAAIAAGGEALFAGVTFTSAAGITIRVLVGLLLVFLGLAQVGVVPVSLHPVSRLVQPLLRGQARLRRERPVAGFALFGFAYVLAGFG
ncbi:MAG: cytochrome c biogenesis protein CcdA [Acidimicrobiia bacterium]